MGPETAVPLPEFTSVADRTKFVAKVRQFLKARASDAQQAALTPVRPVARGDVLMTEPLTPPPLTFQELKELAWVRIPRDENAAALYASENLVIESIERATEELHTVFTSPLAERLISREEALRNLSRSLERCRPSGAIAARIMVDRYGMKKD